MDDLLSEFLTETNENIDSLDIEIVRLEQNPNDPELLGNIFRLVHTIKGTSGFLGLARLESIAHAGENVLGNFRDGSQKVTPEAVSLILAALDAIKSILAVVEETEAEPEGDDSELIARLDAMYQEHKDSVAAAKAAPAAAKAAPAADQAPAKKTSAQPPSATLYERLGGVSLIDTAVELMYRKIDKDPELSRFFDGADMNLLQGRQVEFMVKALGGPDEYQGRDLRTAHRHLVQNGLDGGHFDQVAAYLAEALNDLEIAQPLIDEVIALVATTRDEILGLGEDKAAEVAEQPTAPEPAAAEPAAAAAAPQPPNDASDAEEPAHAKESAIASQSIRVSVDLLESLMTTVSELVLTRNQLMQMVRKYEDSEFKIPLQRLSHVTTDLQEGVMKTRMQPIGNAWSKLPRIIRDLSLELGKKIDLQMIGAETELDRQVLELVKDPLMHMVRNSADHGLETPEIRVAAGKTETGKVVLKAFHEGGHIIIEISDDGRGIDIAKVKEKAIASGLATAADIENLAEQQILQFIFKPGFSTAEKVTAVSGRGVGMDVVRTNIEKIGGQIELRSIEGRGSTFTIKIPLTLAIVSALIIECRTERYAIPQLSVVELVRITKNSEHRIETINATPVLRLRNRLLPLVSLAELLKFNCVVDTGEIQGEPETASPGAEPSEVDGETQPTSGTAAVEPAKKTENKEVFIVVTQVGTYTFGIVVDGVFDAEEIVVKPVAPLLRDIPVYSGTTILGDGSVIMILDPNGIAAATGEISIADQASEDAAAAAREAAEQERITFLIFRAGGSEPKAVPLALVARLEEFDRDTIEYSGGSPVVQYRGQLMPLHAIQPDFQIVEQGRQPVLVFTDRDHSMGLMVDEIIDIVEDRLDIQLASKSAGLIGSAVIDGKATDVIDASAFLIEAFGDWFLDQGDVGSDKASVVQSLLLVDDSAFFRNLLAPLLTVAGYDVTTVESADRALSLRESGRGFDVIVSDIEMPGMTGFEFAEVVRKGGPWKETPLVALSSHATSADLEKGRVVGFNDYVAKFDREALLKSISQTLSGLKGAA